MLQFQMNLFNQLKTSFISLSLILIIFSLRTHASELAKVNQTSITQETLKKRYEAITKLPLNKYPTLKEILDEMIKEEVANQEAVKENLRSDPLVIDRIRSVMYISLLEKKINLDDLQISDEEMRSFYEKYPDLKISHIFISIPYKASKVEQESSYERANKAFNAIAKNSMTFSEGAQKFSEAPTAYQGGDLGFLTKDLDPLFYDTALKLGQPGKVSKIIQTPSGYQIIKLTAIRPWENADKTLVKRSFLNFEKNKKIEAYMVSLMKKQKIVIHPGPLKL